LREQDSKIRVFIALDLPARAKQTLYEVIQKLRSELPSGVRWVDPSGVHLTLKFLGDVDSSSVAGILEAIRCAVKAAPGERFGLRLSGLGLFPNPERPRVLWAGLDGDLGALRSLQERVDEALSKLGFAKERRLFTPHLTLGRVRDSATADLRRRVSSSLAANRLENGEPWQPDAVHLVRSTLTPQGASYTILGSVPVYLREAASG
jgi:2'-5' RNA ligase